MSNCSQLWKQGVHRFRRPALTAFQSRRATCNINTNTWPSGVGTLQSINHNACGTERTRCRVVVGTCECASADGIRSVLIAEDNPGVPRCASSTASRDLLAVTLDHRHLGLISLGLFLLHGGRYKPPARTTRVNDVLVCNGEQVTRDAHRTVLRGRP